MKYTKAAAVVAGCVMALGGAAPALAADADNKPGDVTATAKGSEKKLLDSDTKTKQDLKNPFGNIDVVAWLGSLDKVADKLKTNNDTSAKTKVGNNTQVR